jgi:ERCC4-related helicase
LVQEASVRLYLDLGFNFISAEIALPRLQSEIKVALFLFASRSFLANHMRFMIKLIGKAIALIVINVNIHNNKRKRLYSSSV